MNIISLLVAACACVLVSISSSATAVTVVMDFGVGPTLPALSEWIEDGFRATPIDSGVGNNHFDVSDRTATGEREILIHSGNNAEEVLFDYFGTPFNLLSLDVDGFLLPEAGLWEIVSPTGATRDLSTIRIETFSGPDWENITAFTIRSTIIPLPGAVAVGSLKEIEVDNITVEAVPIPPAVWLFGSGLLGVIGIARRKRA